MGGGEKGKKDRQRDVVVLIESALSSSLVLRLSSSCLDHKARGVWLQCGIPQCFSTHMAATMSVLSAMLCHLCFRVSYHHWT